MNGTTSFLHKVAVGSKTTVEEAVDGVEQNGEKKDDEKKDDEKKNDERKNDERKDDEELPEGVPKKKVRTLKIIRCIGVLS